MADKLNPIAEVGRQGCWTACGCILIPTVIFCVIWFVCIIVNLSQGAPHG